MVEIQINQQQVISILLLNFLKVNSAQNWLT